MRKALWLTGIAAAVAVAACAQERANTALLSAYPGMEEQITNYYDNSATEEDWDCDEVQMDAITETKIVKETPTSLKMAVHYYFQPEDNNDGQVCRGFNTRFFVFARNGDAVSIESMSGPQR